MAQMSGERVASGTNGNGNGPAERNGNGKGANVKEINISFVYQL